MIPKRKLGLHGPEVSALGYGCMGLNFGGVASRPPSRSSARRLRAA